MANMQDDVPGGVWYEPHSLWSITRQVVSAGNLNGGSFDQEHFRNGTRWPLKITRLSFAPINYIVNNDYDDTLGFPQAIYGGAVLQNGLAWVRAPFRQDYSKNPVRVASYSPRPNAEPGTMGLGEVAGTASRGPLFGQNRLNFEKPLYIGRTSSCVVALSSVPDFNVSGAAPASVLIDNDVTSVPATVSWFEEGGLFAGNARALQMNLPVRASADTEMGTECWPYPLPYPFVAPSPTNNVPFWAPEGVFSATEFNRQNATRSGSTKALALSVAFDSLAYTTAIVRDLGATGATADLAMRVGISVRGPNGDYWWRPGAPVGLVLDSISTALSFELSEPITLGPGDVLDVERFMPGLSSGLEGDYILGCAFNGYIAIEG